MSSHLHNLTRYYLSCFYLEKWKQREMFSNLSKVVSPVSGYSGTSSAWLLDPCVFFLLYPAGSSETLPYLLQLHSNLPLSDLFDASVSVCYIGFFWSLLSGEGDFAGFGSGRAGASQGPFAQDDSQRAQSLSPAWFQAVCSGVGGFSQFPKSKLTDRACLRSTLSWT